MGDDWRVRIEFGDLPSQLKSCRQELIPALGGRLGDQVAVTSNDTQIFLYAPSAASADEAAHAARDVLAQHDISAPVWTECWSPLQLEWRDAGGEALAGHLAARGWRVRPRRRYLIAWADCEDDAKSLARELDGDGRDDAGTTFRIRRVSYDYIPDWGSCRSRRARKCAHVRGDLRHQDDWGRCSPARSRSTRRRGS